jgi:hypothetical protein
LLLDEHGAQLRDLGVAEHERVEDGRDPEGETRQP